MLRRTLMNGALALASLLLVFLASEVVCRIFFPDVKIRYRKDPELLVTYEPNQTAAATYLSDGTPGPIVRINGLGLRGSDVGELPSRRLLLLGDSFTMGAGVEGDEIFAARLDEALGDEVAIVNGGQGGFGIFQLEIRLKRLLPVVRPELTIAVIWEGMILRQPPSIEETRRFFERSNRLRRLKALSVLGTHLYRRYERLALRLGRDDLIVKLGVRESAPSADERREQYRRALAADLGRLLRMRGVAESDGSELALVFWPREAFVGANSLMMSGELTARLTEFAREAQIRFYSLQETFEPHSSGSLLIPNDGHPTSFAHCVVARSLLEMLVERGYPHREAPACTKPPRSG